MEVYFSGVVKNCTVSSISSLAPSSPATSLKVTFRSFFASKNLALHLPKEKLGPPPPPAPPPPAILRIRKIHNTGIKRMGRNDKKIPPQLLSFSVANSLNFPCS